MSFLRSGGELCFPHHISNPQQPQVDTDYTDIAIRYLLVRLRNVGCLLHIFHSAPGWWLVVVEAVFIKSGGCEGDEEMILCSHQSHQGPVITCLAWKATLLQTLISRLSFVSVDKKRRNVWTNISFVSSRFIGHHIWEGSIRSQYSGHGQGCFHPK